MEQIKKILVTGAKGFIGKNLTAHLRTMKDVQILEVEKQTDLKTLELFVKQADFIFHLAGINRPLDEKEFIEGNVHFTEQLLSLLAAFNHQAPIVMSSSIQAEQDNPYGRSKKASEDLVIQHHKTFGNPIFIYRLSNVFGKWSRPNYNSVVATFCHAIANDLPITIHHEHAPITLVYIDDVITEFIKALQGDAFTMDGILRVLPEYTITVGQLSSMIHSFKQSRSSLYLIHQDDPLLKKLYSTYLSYLDPGNFIYDLKTHQDHRGSFTELLKFEHDGQVSVNVTKPGITKGNHYHHTKNEKFIVVSGHAEIAFRHLFSNNVVRYQVDGETIRIIDIPPGYIHSIKNIGQVDLVTIMWASEPFDPKNPDTFPMEVEHE
jgi:UDP-2-acetamido-2,6-beta-L-arabino-hexul-4-ose reductase